MSVWDIWLGKKVAPDIREKREQEFVRTVLTKIEARAREGDVQAVAWLEERGLIDIDKYLHRGEA